MRDEPVLREEQVLKTEVVDLRGEADIVRARQVVRTWAADVGLGLVDQTKIVTAASELARNTVIHAGGGTMRLELLAAGMRKGLRLVFEDSGPGIPDIELALRDGYTTRSGMGLGLGGAKRLTNEFEISSTVNVGTTISIARWK